MSNNVNVKSNAQWIEQDISAKLDYSQDWPDLLPAGDSIVSSVWTPHPGATFTNQLISGSTTSVWIECSVVGLFRITNTVTSAQGRKDSRTFLLVVSDASAAAPEKSALFFRDEFIARFRSDRLPSIAQFLPLTVSDDFLWGKLKAAEADVAHKLRVLLVPTKVFAGAPTQAEIDALAGAPYIEEPPYDFSPEMRQGDRWGFFPTRQKPVISMQQVEFVWLGSQSSFAIPADWVRVDKKYGHVQFVPTGVSAGSMPLSMFMMQAMGGGRTIPQMIHVRYTAGLENAARDYPDLLDLIQRMAMVRMLADAMLPASGSISADGLSQSMSPPDLDKMGESLDKALDAIRDRIHGIRVAFL
jgi:hypothetical protein